MEVFHSNFALTLLQDFIERCKSLVIDEVVQVVQFDAHEELNKLEEKLLVARGLLDSFQSTSNNGWQHQQRWVEKVTGVSYDAEDLVDDIMLDASKISSIFEKISSILSRGSMGRKIQGLQDRLELIIKGLDMVIKTNQQPQQRSLLVYSKDFVVEKDQVLHPEKVFGRDEDKTVIIDMLLEEHRKIISIVGMDGLGKTSLAKYAVDDPRIRDNFHKIVWVSVNDRFNLGEMIAIFEKSLQGEHNVLIVLDDLWEVKDSEWSLFNSRFSNTNGCKVLLTTNYLKVAMVAESISYQLQIVKDEDCQALIMDKAVMSNNIISEFRCAFLKDIAQAMAQKCKGLPVVANILGRLLSSKFADESNEEWRTYPQKDISELGVLEEQIFPAFRLNYLCLTSHLRKCLAYCALFPYKYDFKKDNLVQLWMAEGFLLPQRLTSLEQVGSGYFKELLSKSVFQPSGIHDQEMPSYNMHEFIHRFAESLSSYTCCQLKNVENSSLDHWYKKARHLSLLCDTITLLLLKEIEKCDGLRTLLLLSDHVTHIGQVPYSLFQKLRRLRVLDLSCTDIEKLPDSLGRITNLRYLDASETPIQRLPESASELHRLQVLKLRGCTRFRELPKNLKNLTNLIHLDMDMKGLRCMPASLGSLSNLKTLPFFIIGKKEGYRITELKNLKFLCGTVCLTNLEKVKDGAEAKEAMIWDKASIKRLELKWRSSSGDELIVRNILAGLQPHQYLEELQVSNYGGSSFPAWLTSPSYKLVSIHMQKCRNVCVLPSLGQLPCLKRLYVEGLDLVEGVDYRFCGEGTTRAFPSLESLTLINMKGLLRWCILPENSMSKLCDLIFENCPYLSSIHSLKHVKTLQTLEINRCPELITLPELPVSIQSLIIGESDEVTLNMQLGGPQWCSIKDIPYVEIDGTEVNGGSI